MKLSGKMFQVAALLVLAAGTPAGCSSDDDAHEDENPNEEACEHLVEGEFKDLTAAAARGDDAPSVADDHKAYRVAVADGVSGKGGFVRFAANEAGEYVVFTGVAATVSVTTSAGAPVAAESTEMTVPECSAVKGRHAFDLTVGTFFLELGSTEAVVPVVIERGAHSH